MMGLLGFVGAGAGLDITDVGTTNAQVIAHFLPGFASVIFMFIVFSGLIAILDSQFAVVNRFNNIIVQVRGRGDAFYNSKFVPKSSLIKEPDLDPLAYLLPKAKEKGLKVHVWLNTYLLWSSGIKPIQSEHLANTKIEWIDHNQIQQKSIEEILLDNKNRKNGNYWKD